MTTPTTPSFNRLRLSDGVLCEVNRTKEQHHIKRGQYSQFVWEVLLSVLCQSTGVTVLDIKELI